MPAPILDLVIDKGETFHLEVRLIDPAGVSLPIVGWSAKMQVRPYPGSPDLLLEASTVAGTITLAAGGRAIIDVPAETVNLIPLTGREQWAAYDLLLTKPAAAERPLLDQNDLPLLDQNDLSLTDGVAEAARTIRVLGGRAVIRERVTV